MHMLLCLCNICLNSKFLFDVLMAKVKKDGDETFESLSSFFMYECSCPKDPNGYYQWPCVNKQCKDCKKSRPAALSCQSSSELVTVDQFETVKREYLKVDKETKEIQKHCSNMTDHVSTQMTYKDLYKKLTQIRKPYTIHKYYVYNDLYHWPRILATTVEYGEITQ